MLVKHPLLLLLLTLIETEQATLTQPNFRCSSPRYQYWSQLTATPHNSPRLYLHSINAAHSSPRPSLSLIVGRTPMLHTG